MRYAAIKNVDRVNTAFRRVQRAFNFWQHTTRNCAVSKEPIDFTRGKVGQQLTGLVKHPRNIGQQHQFFCLEHRGKFPCNHVRVDVVAFVGLAKPNWADDWNKSIILQGPHHTGIDAHNFTHKTDVMLDRWVGHIKHFQLLCTNQATITPRQAHGFSACLVDQAHNILLHLTRKYPFNHFHRFFIRDTHTLDEAPFFAQTIQCGLNLRSTAMDNHRIHTDQFKQHHILRKIRLQCGIRHGITAILDDDGLAVKFPDVRQGLREYLGFVSRRNVRKIRNKRGCRLAHQIG